MSVNDLNERGYEAGTVQDHVVGLLSNLALHEGVLLDLGCGFGSLASACSGIGLEYVGIDLDEDGLEDLTKRGFATSRIDLADTAALPDALEAVLAGRQLAAVTLLDVIEHLSNPGDLLATLAQVASRHTGAPAGHERLQCLPL